MYYMVMRIYFYTSLCFRHGIEPEFSWTLEVRVRFGLTVDSEVMLRVIHTRAPSSSTKAIW